MGELPERGLLRLEISLKVDVRGLKALVSKPKRDDGAVDTSLQEVHRSRVAHDMGRDLLAAKAETALGCDIDRFVQDVADAVTGQWSTPRVGECEVIGGAADLFEPSFQDSGGLGP